MVANHGRRGFLRIAGGAALATPWFWTRNAGARAARVVVIGGGAGGAILARTLARSGAGLDITLIEPKTRYTTCFFSNRYITGLQDFNSITHGYDRLAGNHGVRVLHQAATGIDPDARTVRLSGGETIGWDRLVVAPGIDFRWDAIEGYGPQAAEIMPHAWRAGAQSQLLRAQLEAMEDGGTFLIAPPENPYRCPSGPYERVSLVAHYFKQAKPKSKILILDAKSEFPLQAQFEEGWANHYADMIEVIPADFSGGPRAVDPSTMTVMSEDDDFKAAVANIIPPQIAGKIARDAGLADDSGWCPINHESLESAIIPGIHVIGDAAIVSPMPKAGYTANIQAKICARAIILALIGKAVDPPVTSGACWSHITPDNAVREYAEYEFVDGVVVRTILDISLTGEDDNLRAATAGAADRWYRDITHEMFG
ncbi:MAG: FAD-dependent oxidoreductase [Proteobacteria bacterium]|nr:FAD-dependent oxidoreductase [Pseudomonadota bacterium]